MDILKSDIKRVYRKYLLAALGSALITSIYSIVDMVVVGQYEGPMGSAALSVVMPLWSLIISLGLLVGIGGSVMMSVSKGAGNEKKAREYYTSSLIIVSIMTAVITVLLFIFQENLMRFFGADDTVLPYALGYIRYLLPFIPCFIMGQFLVSFIRNDNAPTLATIAILSGGGFNIFGDIFFVFGCDMGIEGAGLATGVGQAIAIAILISHFLSKKNTLKVIRTENFSHNIKDIFSTGFAPYILDVSFGIIVIIFNNQIMHYAGTTELSVFGVVANCTILLICLCYGVGQALQPIASTNFGAKKYPRVYTALGSSVKASLIICFAAMALVMAVPEAILSAFMDADATVLAAGPPIMRVYAIAYPFMGICIVSSYYLQSVLKTKESLIVSILRGFVICTVLLYSLPAIFGFDAIWFTIPITEAVTMLVAIIFLKKDRKQNKLRSV